MAIVDLIGPSPVRTKLAHQPDIDPDGSDEEIITLDCTLSIDEDHEVQITEIPIETGATLSDHAVNKPVTLRMSGIVSDAPADALEALDSIADDTAAKSQTYYDSIRVFKDQKIPLMIVTERRVFESMMLTSIRFHADPTTGKVLSVEISAREVFFAESARVALAEDVQPTATPKKKAPKKATKEVAEDRSSAILQSAPGLKDALPSGIALP